MTVTRTYQYRCYPDNRQDVILRGWQRECWEIQRALITQRRWIISQRGIDVSVWRELDPDRAEALRSAGVFDGPGWIERYEQAKQDHPFYLPFAKEPEAARADVHFIHQMRGARRKRVVLRSVMPRDGKGRPRINWAAQQSELTAAVTEAKHSRDRELKAAWAKYRTVPSTCIGSIVERVDQAFQKYVEKAVTRMPRWPRYPRLVGLDFRGEERGTTIMDAPASVDRMVAEASRRFTWWSLAETTDKKLGRLKVRMHRPIPADATILQARLNRAADGWYLSLVCVIPDPVPLPKNTTVIGVDLNVKREGNAQEVAAISDERIYRVTDHLRCSEQRLARLQKQASPTRTVRGTAKAPDPTSKRSARRRVKIAQLHQRVARQRVHVQHYIAKRLTDSAGVVVVEDIRWSNLKRSPKKQATPLPGSPRPKASRAGKRGLHKALTTAAPARLVALIEAKANAKGRRMIKVSARHTSQTCHACGVRSAVKLSLRVRSWVCDACGVAHHRDINAARNIRNRGVALLATESIPPAFSGCLRGEDLASPEGTDVPTESPTPPMNREGSVRPARGGRRTTPIRRATPETRTSSVYVVSDPGDTIQIGLWDDG